MKESKHRTFCDTSLFWRFCKFPTWLNNVKMHAYSSKRKIGLKLLFREVPDIINELNIIDYYY